MTRLTIKNEDASRTAVVHTIDFDPTTGKESPPSVGSVGPGQWQDVWIHSSRKVVLLELQEAAATASAPTSGSKAAASP